MGASGRVVAIEASPRIFPFLRQNVTINHLSNVSLLPYAAHDGKTDSVDFYEAPLDHFGMGSLAAQFEVEPISVPARSLDRMLAEESVQRVDVMKADVEGNERNAFWGARNLLTGPRAPLIVFEFSDWAENRMPQTRAGDTQRLLLEWGYRIWKLEEFRNGKGQPLRQPIQTGWEMLVAAK